MFAYCLNNPVNLIDTEGTWPNLSSVFLGIAIAAVAVAFAALCVVTCGGAAVAGGAIVATTVAAQVGVAAAGVSAAAFMSAAVSKAVETGIYESRKNKHEEDVEKGTSPGKRKGKIMSENHAPHNNQAQNKQAHDVARKMKLNKKQEEALHRAISGEKWSFQDVLKEAGYIKNETK